MNNEAKIEQCKKDIELLQRELRKLKAEQLTWIDSVGRGSLIKLDCGYTFLVGICGDKYVLTSVSPKVGLYNGAVGGPWDNVHSLRQRLRDYAKDYRIELVDKNISLS